MHCLIAFFAAFLLALQLVAAVPAAAPAMAYGGLVSKDLRTDSFNRIRLAPGYESPAVRRGRVSSGDAPDANGESINNNSPNGTIINENGSAHAQNGGNSISGDAHSR